MCRSCFVMANTSSSFSSSSTRSSPHHRNTQPVAFVVNDDYQGFHSSSRSIASSYFQDVFHTRSIDRTNRSLLLTLYNTKKQSGIVRHKFATMSTTTTSLDATSNAHVDAAEVDDGFFASQDVTFESIGVQSPVLIERLQKQLGLTRPTQIQAKAFASIRGRKDTNLLDNDVGVDDDGRSVNHKKRARNDVTIGAETGSGKTLAYLLPLLDDILTEKAEGHTSSYDYARAVILVPNKELVQQVLRMAVPLCGGTLQQSVLFGGVGATTATSKPNLLQELATNQPHMGDESDISKIVRLAVLPGGLNEPLDFKPFRDCLALGGKDPPVDIVICTPAALGPFGLKPKVIDMFADIRTLVVDEADMLLGKLLPPFMLSLLMIAVVVALPSSNKCLLL
jgi:hypothetical protein